MPWCLSSWTWRLAGPVAAAAASRVPGSEAWNPAFGGAVGKRLGQAAGVRQVKSKVYGPPQHAAASPRPLRQGNKHASPVCPLLSTLYCSLRLPASSWSCSSSDAMLHEFLHREHTVCPGLFCQLGPQAVYPSCVASCDSVSAIWSTLLIIYGKTCWCPCLAPASAPRWLCFPSPATGACP